MTDIKDTLSLSERFRLAMLPLTEEQVYQQSIEQKLWSIDQFVALLAGLTPENFKNGSKGSMEISDEVFAKREAYGHEIFSKFLNDMKDSFKSREFILTDDNMYLSSWKYIKWMAQNKIPIRKRFFNSLPLYLMELYFEFQPTNVALRTVSHYTRTYHKALYLHNAENLLEEHPHLKPTQLYRHPRMQSIEDYIRQLGGKYKKRTFIESWLPEVVESPRGRPRT